MLIKGVIRVGTTDRYRETADFFRNQLGRE
jgi:hypothetical protein